MTGSTISEQSIPSATVLSASSQASQARKSKQKSESEFGGELMAAQGAVMQPGLPGLEVKPDSVAELSKMASPVAGTGYAASAASGQGKASEIRPENTYLRSSSAERSAATQKEATSLNTASAIAGLKPWDKEWVFEGMEKSNPNVKPLFSSSMEKANREEMMGEKSPNGFAGKWIYSHGRGDAENVRHADIRPGQALAAENVPDSGLNASMFNEVNALIDNMHGGVYGLNGGEEAVGETRERAGLNSRSSLSSNVSGNVSGNISGDDFLRTMSAVQGKEPNGSEARNQDSEDSRGSLKQKPRLSLIDGGFKGKKLRPEIFDGQVLPASLHAGRAPELSSGPLNARVPSANVNGYVVKGAMAKDRLSSESLMGISGGIRNLSPQGGGEIRLRLKPDNLGELHLRVVTSGKNVSLTVKASDEQAKRVFEDSISYLKENLASHNLTLGKVELSVSQGSANASAGDTRQDSGAEQYRNENPGLSNAHGNGAANDNRRSAGYWSAVDGDLNVSASGKYGASARNSQTTDNLSSSGLGSNGSNGRIDIVV